MTTRIENPRASVIIPTHNRAPELKRCLESLRKQSMRDFEVLVCDDGSTDDTEAVARSYSEFLDITYAREENFGGPARPRNRGIALARAPYVAFLDADDWWSPRKLEESLKYLEQGADIVYHDLYLVRRVGQRVFWRKARTRDLVSPVFHDLASRGNALNNSSVVARRDLLTAIGGFSEDRDLIAIEDFDAWLRAAKISERFKRVPKVLGYYWAGGAGISNPKRTIETLAALQIRHGAAFDALGNQGWWIDYAIGRSYYRLGLHELATSHLERSGRGSAPLAVNLKSRLMLSAAPPPSGDLLQRILNVFATLLGVRKRRRDSGHRPPDDIYPLW